jgi:diguanylate cyclase (GGDEF)-like protein
MVMDRLAHAAGRLGRSGLHVALVFLDLDHFKLINDNLGHRAGDEVLREVADRLLAAVRPGDTVGRFGGDEFVVLCEDVEGEAMALAIAQRLEEAFAAPFSAGGAEHRLGASMGVALLQGAQEADALLRDADAAMYRAKERGRERIELFDTGMRDQAQGRLHMEAGLRRAVAGDEIELHYQPIVNLDDGTIAAVEALVRWRDPRRGLLGPGTFMAIAEDSGLVVALGRRTLELACAEAARWSALRPGRRPLPVHVNVSARQLVDEGLPEAIEALLAASGTSASALALEITEPVLADRRPGRQATFERLRGLGVGLILDDFGTGSSSLGHLGELPVDGLKIDRSFVAGLARGQTPVVDAILRLARAFSLPVIAEGVEDTRQLLALRRLGCALGQGHFFSAALTAEALLPLVAADEPPFG